MPPPSPAQRDEIRIATAKVVEGTIKEALRRYGDDPLVLTTAVDGVMTAAAFAVWQRRDRNRSTFRFRMMFRALVSRALRLVTSAP